LGYRLDKLQKHYNAKHKDSFPNEDRTLLDMGFSLSGASGADQGAPEAQPATLSSGDHETVHGHEDHQAAHLPEPAPPRPAAIAELHSESDKPYWETFERQVDSIVKANSATPKAIAEEVLRMQQQQHLEKHGTGLVRENWREHQNETDMVRDAGLAFRDTDDGAREVYCPVCESFKESDGNQVIKLFPRIGESRKAIGRHLESQAHKKAVEEEQREEKRKERRRRVGLTVARTALQTLREGSSYVQFESKLLSHHLAGTDIGSLNHSREFIRAFVGSMMNAMDTWIGDHLNATDSVIGRKRIFAFMADKVTELHRTRDAIALLIMSEEGEVQPVFADFLLVKGHTGEDLMRDIYDKTFMLKLRLSPAAVRDQCTGAAFDGQYFCLKCPEVLATRIIEQAKGSPPTRTEIQHRMEWMICTWDPAHRLELVAKDIRLDRLGIDVELAAFPWYV
jgi:hypothetical protein